MSGPVRRYDVYGGFGIDQWFEECDDGEYVKYDDYETVVRERDKARVAIARQASAFKYGLDAATKVSSAQIQKAARLRAESNPDALESERAMNARLTEENEQLRRALDEAPHASNCQSYIDRHYTCNCYKACLPRAGGE